ncbi:DUF2382 domain-containing protein [Vallicoccus soli]|uniref:DUF2382 domain-containing protein n=1 Tax=Vallicoccus soli TaxID=2339232 RepID=A0A3A3YYJ5_9ACTN|nr:DUF2382 domain-containing protein [Vallicoccus soli]RJK94198.1 DUF2382 domain-containing protein [Vallicoccus soli]
MADGPRTDEHGAQGQGAVVELREERAVVDVTRVPAERVRWGKRVVVEERTVVVRLRREEFFLERERLDGGRTAGEALPGAGQGADEGPRGGELVLHEERAEVVVTTVPVERVRVAVDRQVVDSRLEVELRREEAELVEDGLVDGPDAVRGGGTR